MLREQFVCSDTKSSLCVVNLSQNLLLLCFMSLMKFHNIETQKTLYLLKSHTKYPSALMLIFPSFCLLEIVYSWKINLEMHLHLHSNHYISRFLWNSSWEVCWPISIQLNLADLHISVSTTGSYFPLKMLLFG